MTWTYDVTLLATDSTTQVRAMIRDTDESNPLIQDEEIAFNVLMYPPPTGKPPYYAAAATCDMICFNFAQEVQNSIGPLSESAQQKYDHYVALSQSLRVLAATGGKGVIPGSLAGTPAAGPILGGGGRKYLGTTRYADPEGE